MVYTLTIKIDGEFFTEENVGISVEKILHDNTKTTNNVLHNSTYSKSDRPNKARGDRRRQNYINFIGQRRKPRKDGKRQWRYYNLSSIAKAKEDVPTIIARGLDDFYAEQEEENTKKLV